MQLGGFQNAIPFFEKALKINPDDEGAKKGKKIAMNEL